jgi:uncharacterized protein with ParB-like and HNH nuclease domain
MYHPGGTIEKAIKEIQLNNYVLPAIQREFVWKPEQIEKLFDSLMQGYPFGAFLFWKVLPDTSKNFQLYDFVRNYHQKKAAHCPKLDSVNNTTVIAVLDGQQRLTALNIGLRGSMALKIKGKRWDNPNAYPKKFLYIDLFHEAEKDETGIAYNFKFLTEKESEDSESELWFKVGDILDMKDENQGIFEYIEDCDLDKDNRKLAFTTLSRLLSVIRKNPTIAYYEEDSQELDRVLNIFIRLNSGGTVLSYSDLLLSIAVAQWKSLDAREEIHDLVDNINEIGSGFNFNHDFVLKAGLMLADISSVGFKVENFTAKNMAILEKNWSDIKSAIIQTVQVAASFGLSGTSLRAESSLLPKAYYIYKRETPKGFEDKLIYKKDRENIQLWLFRSLLKSSGIWGSGLDTFLNDLRKIIKKDPSNGFPVAEIENYMNRRGKSLSFDDDEIDELLDIRYRDRRAFFLLSIVFPFLDLKNQFHIDHVYPISHFSSRKLEKLGYDKEESEDMYAWADSIANLQLLEGQQNKEKLASKPATWLNNVHNNQKSKRNYCDNHMLGSLPNEIDEFMEFAETRHDKIRSTLANLLKTKPEKVRKKSKKTL